MKAGQESFFYLDPRSLKVRVQASHRLDRPFAIDVKVTTGRSPVIRLLYKKVRVYAVFGEIHDDRLVKLDPNKYNGEFWPDGVNRLIQAIDVVCEDPTLKKLGLFQRRYNFYIPATAVAA